LPAKDRKVPPERPPLRSKLRNKLKFFGNRRPSFAPIGRAVRANSRGTPIATTSLQHPEASESGTRRLAE